MHTSLDGFVGGPNGEMDWIDVNDEMFEYAGQRTREADTALYGRHLSDDGELLADSRRGCRLPSLRAQA
jgi:hypothetical protein